MPSIVLDHQEIEMEPAPIVVDFPLRGEWVASHPPAERIPSHDTDALGQRCAYDFLRIERERKGWKFFRVSALHYLLLGVKLNDCYGWGQPIHAPFDGTVIVARDGWPERKWLHFLRGFAIVLKVLLRHPVIFGSRKTNGLRRALGNYIILKKPEKEIYAFFAHARYGSIQVIEGEEVCLGQHLAEVGHSGNSTAPHLHFHLMDRANILEAQGLPCRFRACYSPPRRLGVILASATQRTCTSSCRPNTTSPAQESRTQKTDTPHLLEAGKVHIIT